MKSYNHLYDLCLTEDNRRRGAKSVKKSKRIRRMLKRRHLSDDALAADAYEWIAQYETAHHEPVKIIDGTNRKERFIIVPTLEELMVQHCIVNVLKSVFQRGMYKHTYASIPKRGSHKAKRVIEKWIKNDTKNTKYVLKMDIRHFFDTIPHDILKAKLARIIRDERMLDLLYKIIDVTDVGIPLGYHTSQWLSNWYLQDLDHFIKEKLGAKYYVRYMDDMVIFGSNKKELHKIRAAISEYLQMRLGLELKGNWQVYRFSHGLDRGRDLDFMGFRFYRSRTTMRRSIMLKASRKARKIFRKPKLTIHDARQMMSYLGWIDSTNTYKMYEERIKPYIKFGALKRKIGIYDRFCSRNLYTRLVKFYTKGGRKK